MANPKYAKLPEREAQKRVVHELEELTNPSIGNLDGRVPHKGMNRQAMNNRLKQEKKRLDEITPPQVENDHQRRFLVEEIMRQQQAMENGCAQADIPSMPTKQEMDEADAGSVGKHLRWEKFWKKHYVLEDGHIKECHPNERGAISRWKDARRALYQQREEDDPDVSNVEIFRPDQHLETSRRTVHAPFANSTYEEYEQIWKGKSRLSDIQLSLRRFEQEQIETPPPAVEDIYKVQPKIKPESLIKYICGAKASNGTICRMKVKKKGDRCRHHQGEEHGY